MEWQVILVLVLAVPVVLIPVALILYMNLGGIYLAIKDAREKRATRAKGTRDARAPKNKDLTQVK